MIKLNIFCSIFCLFFFGKHMLGQSRNTIMADNWFVSYYQERQNSVRTELLNKANNFSENSNVQSSVLSKESNYKKGVGYYYFNAAQADVLAGNTEASIQKITKSAAIFSKIKSTKDFVLAQYYKGHLLVQLDRGAEGYEIINKTLKQIKSSDNYLELSYLHLFCGQYHSASGDLDNSVFNLGKAVFYSKKISCTPILLISYDHLVNLYLSKNGWEMASQYSKKQREILVDLKSTDREILPITQGNILYNSGIIYLHLGNYSKALTLADSALVDAKKSKDRQFISKSLNLIALIHYKSKDYAKSIAVSQIVLQDYFKNDCFALQILGKNYFMLGQYEKSLRYLESSLLKKQGCNNALTDYLLEEKSIFMDLSRTEFAQGNYKSANEFEKKYFENQLDTVALEVLTNNQKLKEKALSEADYSFFVTLLLLQITFIILIIVVCCLFKNYKKVKRTEIKNLELVNSIYYAEKSLKKKRVLLKEIHHRVKNNLQMVISLLNIQARHDAQISIKDFLEKGETRISVLALIHESLSEHENQEQVCLQDYVGNLVTNILKVFDKQGISISLDTESIFIDIQSAITLGLIVNELVSNSIKHGFPESATGEITIRIKLSSPDNYEMFYGDNGIGVDSEKKLNSSLGLSLVESLVKQIEGTINRERANGLAYIIRFKNVINKI